MKLIPSRIFCTHCKKFLEHNKFSPCYVSSKKSAWCKKCHAAKARRKYASRNSAWRKNNRERLREFRHALTVEMVTAYGGECQCPGCDETNPMFLTLEHRDGSGKEHRERQSNTHQLLLELKRLGWPKDRYTLLCYNCNCGSIRNYYKYGYYLCPHDKFSQFIAHDKGVILHRKKKAA